MDHNIDSLNLESTMGVDFEATDSVEVSQGDLSLPSTTNDESMPMEFEQIEEQPMLMDTGSEEIIDFMGDQFALQEYSVEDDQTTGLTTTAESNQNVLTSQAETMIDLQLQTQSSFTAGLPKIISVKAAIPARPSMTTKKSDTGTATAPRQVAIAPKPTRLVAKQFPAGKQFAIAPKPVTVVKKVSIANVVQANSKGNTVLAQIGKQLVVVPAGTQKLKLVTANTATSNMQYVMTGIDQPPLIQAEEQTKPVMMAKVILQGQGVELGAQAGVLRKLSPAPPRYVAVQQKPVPIAIGNKVVMASPTKQPIKLGKKQQIITIKSPTPKLVPTTPTIGSTSSNVVLTTNPGQNVILKSAAPAKTAQVSKETNVVIDGQHTQLHQINVPGKGIQYIRLVTNPNASVVKPKSAGSLLTGPSNFVLTDSKGGKKLVRIAPIGPKTSVAQPTRSSQSLLAPLSPANESANLQDMNELLDSGPKEINLNEELRVREELEEVDSKAALRSLIENTVSEESRDMQLSMTEVEIEYKRPISPKREHRTVEQPEVTRAEEPQHSLIVIPSGYDMDNNLIVPDGLPTNDDSQQSLLNMDADMMNTYQSPQTPQTTSEPDMVPADLGLRPRKACNCTKSQCLKLYCDCFANGEFCNRCNCNNCHNNLENEELRQKAIRGCLERNPNAFRPKIGKAKSAGPETIRQHNKGCNCKRSGCLKNYCECYEAKIACTAICKCVGCRNVEESLERFRRHEPARAAPRAQPPRNSFRQPHLPAAQHNKQPCSFMTSEVIEAVCQCLLAAAGEAGGGGGGEAAGGEEREPLRDVIDEFARCLQDIIGAAHHAAPAAPATPALLDQET
ncbi:uncharacterized protein [Epargyreus clarus]|uniref:uncharacterized protein isoform X2 n=1 Tax=Epargyreus clarus TaxID=520877 RepID=UPI003C2C2DD8